MNFMSECGRSAANVYFPTPAAAAEGRERMRVSHGSTLDDCSRDGEDRAVSLTGRDDVEVFV